MLKLKGRKSEAPQVPTAPVASAMPPPPMAAPASPSVPSPSVIPTVKASKKVPGSVSTPPRQRNTAIMVAGAALVLFAGTIAFSVAKSYDDTQQVLVAERSIAEGELIGEDDFRTEAIAASAGGIQAVAPEDMAALVGRRAAGPIGEGTLIHPDQFIAGGGIEEQTLVVGAVLDPNRYPAVGLKAGDQVRLYEVSGGGGFSSGFLDEEIFITGKDLTVAEVTSALQLANNQGMHVSFRVPESVASLVVDRASTSTLAAALLDASATIERVNPLDPAQPLLPIDSVMSDQ